MLCYKDRAFCHSDCVNRSCYRNATPEIKEGARDMNLPISWVDFRKGCEAYMAPAKEDV